MEAERISVITLSYNNLEYYMECLQSIIQQTYENIEWILCDDCSSNFDEYEGKIQKFLKENPGNIQNLQIHRNKKNLGVIKNYEQAIDMATGEYIFYLAIDDMFYDADVLSEVVKYFQETGLEIFGGYWERFYEDGRKQIQPYPYEAELLKNGSVREIFQKFIRIAIVVGACAPFKKSLIREWGFVEEGYTHLEDWPRYLKLLENGVRIGFLERCLVKYRDGGITNSENMNPLLMQDFGKLLGKYMQPPYSNLLQAMKEKKYIIAWGSSGGFVNCHKEWEELTGRKIDLLVDKSQEKWGTYVEGLEVFPTEKIWELPKGDIFVLVFSQTYYLEIAQELESRGLVEGQQFDILSREVVVWQRSVRI